jgi:hypothetical protein
MNTLLPLAFGAILAASTNSFGATILTGPSFTGAAKAPLAGVLQLTTAESSRVSVSVDDGAYTWERNFYDYGTAHAEPLLGFRPGRTNVIRVTVYDKFRNAVTAAQPLIFVTAPLPSDFPKSVLFTNQPDKMEPGYTLFRIVNYNTGRAYVTVVDNQGQVVWYSSAVPTTAEVRQLDNGDLFIPLSTSFTEVNLLGETVKSWAVTNTLRINPHEGLPTGHDSILYINDDSRLVSGFPTSATDPNAPTQTTKLLFNRVIEMSATNGTVLNNWSLIDMLDPLRISYLTFTIHSGLGWDCEHANTVIEDPRDDSSFPCDTRTPSSSSPAPPGSSSGSSARTRTGARIFNPTS